MPHVEAVSAAGVVDVEARVLRVQAIVGAVVDAAERERRSRVAALGGVVVDDVENDLDSGAMQRLDHGLELVDLLSASSGCETGIRGEESQGVVPPVVRESPLCEMLLRDGVVHREELHRRDGQRLEMIDYCLGSEAEVGAAQLLGHVGVLRRQPLHVTLVDQGSRPARARRSVVAPGKGFVDDHAFRHEGGAVPQVGADGLLPVNEGVAEQGVVPDHGPGDGLCVWIHQQLGRIEAVPLLRSVGAVDLVPVELSGAQVGKVRVPDEVGPVMHRNPSRRLGIVGPVEEAQVHAGGVLREEREVGALTVPHRPQRIVLSGPDPHAPPPDCSRASPPAERSRNIGRPRRARVKL